MNNYYEKHIKYEKARFIYNIQSPPSSPLSPETYIPMKQKKLGPIKLVNDLESEYKTQSCHNKLKICCNKCNIM